MSATFATSPAVGPTDALDAQLATTPMSEKTGRALLETLRSALSQLDEIRRYAALTAGELPGDPPTPPTGA